MCPLRHSPDPFANPPDPQTFASCNPYLAKMRQEADAGALPILYGEALKDKKGQWRSHFSLSASAGAPPQLFPDPTISPSLLLEIGCHRGHVLCQMAQDFPRLHVLGMDITLKRVYLSALRARRLHLSARTRILYYHAGHLQHLFAPQELDAVVLFFPDPWTQKRGQQKHRLITPTFAASLASILKPKGYFWLKTDSLSYFTDATEQLATAGFAQAPPSSLWLKHKSSYVSVFEARFRKKQLPVYEGVFLKI